MRRPIVTIAAVIVIDLIVAFFGLLATQEDFNMVQTSRAYEKLIDHPTVANAEAITTLRAEADTNRLEFFAILALVILVITALGFFLAGRQSKAAIVTASSAATSST